MVLEGARQPGTTRLRELQQHILALFEKLVSHRGHECAHWPSKSAWRAGLGQLDGESARTECGGPDCARPSGRRAIPSSSPGPELETRCRLAPSTGLRGALENNRYLLYYQPKIDIASGRLDGVEALLRWMIPSGGNRLAGRVSAHSGVKRE